jgi:hypothetical protein
MVTIIDFKKRTNSEGKEFLVLILQGDVELVQSKETGNFYATARKASISTTFDEFTCRNIIGKQLPGCIVKRECDPYEYVNESTGEIISLNHRYGYAPNENNLEEVVFSNEPVMA